MMLNIWGTLASIAIVSKAGVVTILAQLFNLLGAGSMLVMVSKYKEE